MHVERDGIISLFVEVFLIVRQLRIVLHVPPVLRFFMFPEHRAWGSEIDILSFIFGMTGVQYEQSPHTKCCSTF